MKPAAVLILALGLVLAARTGHADTFAAGSYIIPMETTYQDAGSTYKASRIVMLTGRGVAPGGGQDVWITGFLDGTCPRMRAPAARSAR